MANNFQSIISVIYMNLVEPLLLLVEKLESISVIQVNDVQAPPAENGISCSIVVLSVLILESALNRIKYFREDNSRANNAKYIAEITSDLELSKDVEEVIALRDSIVHNHLWEADIYWDDNYLLKLASDPKLVPGYGNNRFHRIIESNTRLSKRLKLNLFPLKVSREDARRALKVITHALVTLEKVDHAYFPTIQQSFEFRGRSSTLPKIIDSLPG